MPPLACEGTDPDWQLGIHGQTAQFSYPVARDFDIPHRSNAEGREWPKALTLIAERDTAIVILNETSCSGTHVTAWPIEAFILTQKNEMPVILRGCCTSAE